MNENKEYIVTDAIINKFNEHEAHRELRELYAKLPFGHKKAVKCSILAEKTKNEAWCMVMELYPELTGKALNYKTGGKRVTII